MTAPTIVAIVEDDADQRGNYCSALEKHYLKVLAFANKQDALDGLKHTRPDLLVLDIILDQEYDAGFDLYSQLSRRYPDLPVLFLTDRIGEIDTVSGLRMGAWDYQPKPISIDFFVAKVESLLRLAKSTRKPQADRIQTRGQLSIDIDRHTVHWRGQKVVDITVTEFKLLEALSHRNNTIISYQGLATATLGGVVANNTVSTHISNIKRKFKRVDASFEAIRAEYGQGYRWCE